MGSSTTTRNFGMRRFTNLVREGRFRAPASGTELVLGTGVEIDASDTDRVRQVTAGNDITGGGIDGQLVGVLWYEHDSQTYNDPRWGGAAGLLPQDLNTAPNDRMVQVLHGAGAKVWFRNTPADTTEPGLKFPDPAASAGRSAVVMVEDLGTHGTSDLAVGNLLGWDVGNGFWGRTAVAAEAVFRVTDVDHTLEVCDAEFLI